jgi:hypothetical protein
MEMCTLKYSHRVRDNGTSLNENNSGKTVLTWLTIKGRIREVRGHLLVRKRLWMIHEEALSVITH